MSTPIGESPTGSPAEKVFALKSTVAVAVALFSVLVVVAFLLLSFLTIIALSLAVGLGAYLLLLAFYRRFPTRRGRHIPSLLSVALILAPFGLAVVVAYEGVLGWRAALAGVIAYGLLVTFWVNLTTVPLAVRSKYDETVTGRAEKLSYPSMSVIVPAQNEERVIGKTIRSVLASDYPRKQVIVVDDGSTDRTFEIAQSFGSQVDVLQKHNGGKSSALNEGLRKAEGEIIVVVDADTVIGKDSLKEVAKKFSDDNVVAVAGNIKVDNRKGWLANCQALEYIISIQSIRRALDRFGTVTVVPGALGAFRRSILDETGDYHNDTLTEDFDVTIKALKTGLVVQGSSEAKAFTQAPRTFGDLYRQRMRWYRGNFQTIRKHVDVFTNPRFGYLYSLGFPFVLLSLAVVPIVGLVIWSLVVVALLEGMWMFILQMVLLFVTLQVLLATLSILIDDEDPRLIAYSPFFVVGYKQLLDIFTVKALFDVLLRKKLTWARAERF